MLTLNKNLGYVFMIEVRFHGRGGQGAVTAAELLAKAAFSDGKYCLAFPKFGPERTGAPVEAYCRIDDKPIKLRTQVYEPDYLIVLDHGLATYIDITNGMKKNGAIIINDSGSVKMKFRTCSIDATQVALDVIGKPIVNTVMLGAFAKATGIITLKSLEKAIYERFSGKIADSNIAAVRKAYEVVKC